MLCIKVVSSLGTGKATGACSVGGLLCLLLLPAVGWSMFASVISMSMVRDTPAPRRAGA